jgi:hypothetical protein
LEKHEKKSAFTFSSSRRAFSHTFFFSRYVVPLALVVIPSLRASPTKRFRPSRSRSARRRPTTRA